MDSVATEEPKKTRYQGIWIHGNSIRVDFVYKRDRHRHTLGLEPTTANLKRAAGLRSAALFHASGTKIGPKLSQRLAA